MSDFVVNMVTKEDIMGGWLPTEKDMYFHRLSNVMRDFSDVKIAGHDLLFSDASQQKVKTKNVDVALKEYLWNRSVVAINEAYTPIHDALTKTMRKALKYLGANDALKLHFDVFL